MTAADEPLRSPAPTPLRSAFDAYVARVAVPPVIATDRQVAVAFALALVLAVVTDLLFHGGAWGVNVPLWFGALALAVGLGGRLAGRGVAKDRVVLLASSVLLAGVTAWRDAGLLQFAGVLGALTALGLAAAAPSARPTSCATPLTLVLASLNIAAAGGTAWFRFVRAWRWRDLPSTAARHRAEAVMRAVAIALPLLLVFGLLFAAADAVFADALTGLLLPDDLVAHVFLLLFGYGVAAALLWPALCVRVPEQPDLPAPTARALGVTELAIVMGSLALLFAAFVAVQVRYLFGGAEAVQASVDLTYAEYARRGYFELVTASLLLLPVLAALDWARRREGPARSLYLVLAVLLTALLAVIMASAWQRLAIYRKTFGLTELRLYTAVSLPWLSATLLWFLLLVARRRTDCVLAGAAVLGGACLLGLYLLSPDNYIARTNLGRAAAGHEFDVAYAASLSADAVPALLEALPTVQAATDTDAERCVLALRFTRAVEADSDWRSWNYGRARAHRLVVAHDAVPPVPAGCEAGAPARD